MSFYLLYLIASSLLAEGVVHREVDGFGRLKLSRRLSEEAKDSPLKPQSEGHHYAMLPEKTAINALLIGCKLLKQSTRG